MSLDNELNKLPSAWTGHKDFAVWLVQRLQPNITIDLGVDYGFSLFALAIDNPGDVYGIDSFEPDPFAGDHPDNYDVVMRFKNDNNFENVIVIKSWFDEVLKTWDKKIDILHIDALHTYDAVKQDWKNWTKFLELNGVVILHDVISFPELTQFYNEIEWPKAYFSHSAGLGIATQNERLLEDILSSFTNCTRGNI